MNKKKLAISILFISLVLFQSCETSTPEVKRRNELADSLKIVPIYVREDIPMSDPSIKIAVDGKEVYQAPSISDYSIIKRPEIKLSYGEHVIRVSTLDDQYLTTDTIRVERAEMQYWIRVEFKRAASLESYLEDLVRLYYRNRTEGKTLSDEQKSEEMKYIRSEVMKQREAIAKDFDAVKSSGFIISYTDDPFYQRSSK